MIYRAEKGRHFAMAVNLTDYVRVLNIVKIKDTALTTSEFNENGMKTHLVINYNENPHESTTAYKFGKKSIQDGKIWQKTCYMNGRLVKYSHSFVCQLNNTNSNTLSTSEWLFFVRESWSSLCRHCQTAISGGSTQIEDMTHSYAMPVVCRSHFIQNELRLLPVNELHTNSYTCFGLFGDNARFTLFLHLKRSGSLLTPAKNQTQQYDWNKFSICLLFTYLTHHYLIQKNFLLVYISKLIQSPMFQCLNVFLHLLYTLKMIKHLKISKEAKIKESLSAWSICHFSKSVSCNWLL